MPEQSIKTGVWEVYRHPMEDYMPGYKLQSKANLAIVVAGCEFPEALKHGVTSFPNASGDPSLMSRI